MKWEKDTVYRIAPKEQRSVVSTQMYTWDDVTIKYSTTFTNGWVEVLGDGLEWSLDPDGEYGDDGVGKYEPDLGVEVWIMSPLEHDFIDPVGDQIEFSENVDAAEKERVMKSFQSNGAVGIEECSYIHYDTEVFFYGELEIVKK
jgi:hypothetical protein